MPTLCSACTNRQKKGSGISFHSFPHDPIRRQKWISAVGRRGWTPSIHASLCSLHFEEKCFDRTGQTVRLRDGSVPTVFISPLKKRFRKVKKLPETFTGPNVKQEKECTVKVVLTKRQLEAKEEELTYLQELDVDDHTYPKRTHLLGLPMDETEAHCFVCDKAVRNGTPLHFLTNTTKVQMHHKLDKLMARELDLLVNEKEVLCSRCVHLLNYVDRIEVELAMLNRSILNCIRGKHILGLHHEELQSKIPDLNENLPGLVSLFSGNEVDDCSIVNIDKVQVQRTSDINDKNMETDLTQKSFQCQMCFFKTRYKSLMIYHLQQHLKTTHRCDFCNDSVPERMSCIPGENEDYEVKHLSVNGAKNNTNDNICDVIETHVPHDGAAADVLCGIESLLQDLDDSGKVSVQTSKENEVEMKNHLLHCMNVENMLEELHKTGQISTFINDNDNGHCKVKNAFEAELDTNITTSDSASDRCSSIKLELMNVDEGEDEVENTGQGILCQKQVYVDFGSVKSEAQCGSFQDPVGRGNTGIGSSGTVVTDRNADSSNKVSQNMLRPESTFANSLCLGESGCDTKHLPSVEEIVG